VRARQAIEESDTDVFFSIASAWEIVIKTSIGKLALRDPLWEAVAQQEHDNDIVILNITLDHLARLATLPFHHRDPFDRLLIAQSMVEGTAIVSADTVFDVYGIPRIW
jgi:PIN domain nuclease of toxin-antitoxin system